VSRPAQTQALEALVEAHARELHLPAIRSRFRQLAAEAAREQQTPLAYLAALLEAEVQERSERRERRRLIDARFPLIKRLEEFRFADNPKVPQATIAALAEGSWIDDREQAILIGESGTGKTRLAIALACAPASKADACGSPPSQGWRPSCKKPTAAESSAGSSAATQEPR
jgi:DNA replication protein DnaC